MRRFVALSLLVIAPSLHAAVRGTVFSSSGAAVENASVSLFRREALMEERERIASGRTREALATATTDAQGAFALDTKLQGVFELRVERNGFAPWRDMILAGENEVAVDLKPAAMRTGHVLAGGKPVAGAIVVAGNESGVLWSARTDERGSFTIADPKLWANGLRVLHPDHAMLAVRAPASLELTLPDGKSVRGRVISSDRKPVANATLFTSGWPAGATRDDGTFTIAHLPDDVKRIDAFSESELGSARRSAAEIEIRLEPAHSISGVVRDPKGRPLSGARVLALPSDAMSWDDVRDAISDDKGNYSAGFFSAKDYNVQVEAPDLDFDNGAAGLRAARTARLDFTAKARMYVEGTVVDERKRPIAGARLQFSAKQMPVVYASGLNAFGSSATSARDGHFRIAMLEGLGQYRGAGPMRLEATHPKYAAAQLNDFSAKSSPVTITMPDGIEVRGSVTDKEGKAIPGAGIILVQNPFGATPLPLDAYLASGYGRPFVESDAEGNFTLHLNDAPHDLAVAKEGFAPFRLGGMTPAAGQRPLAVVLERGVEIRGRVTAKKGVSSFEGVITAQGEDGSYASVEVREDGSFVIGSIAPGNYTLQYSGVQTVLEKQVKAPAAGVLLELPARGEIRGRVIDKATNAALPQFSVLVMAPDREYGATDEYENVETFTSSAPIGSAEIVVSAPGYISETQRVTVDAEKPAAITIALARGRTISGRVTTETGLPVADATVSLDNDDEDFRAESSAESGSDGEFEITGATREAVTLSVYKQGFISRDVEVEGDIDRRLNIVLSAGLKASGRVVTSAGEPVEGAQIWAHSTTDSGSLQSATSAADGTFAIEGLSAGRYTIQASRSDLGDAQVTDVDPAAAAPILLTFPPSKGAGTIHGTVKDFAGGAWMYGVVMAGAGTKGIIGRDGTYRLENVRAGETEVRAYVASQRDQITTKPVKVTVVANEDIEVNLAIRTDIVLRGTVTEAGQPAVGRRISFSSQGGSWYTKTGENGAYEMNALEPGLYRVTVETSQRSKNYTTRYQLKESATFDVAIAFAQLHGRVVDETGTPQAGVAVEVSSDEQEHDYGAEPIVTDAAGAFSANVTAAPSYVVTATKKGFATAVQRVDNTRAPVVLRMLRSAGLRVRLTDARDGKTLPGIVVATNEARLIAGRTSDPEKDGTYAVPLGPGAYRISVSATGYASQSTRISVPFEGELRMPLTPGGNLVVNTPRGAGDLVKLVMPSGEEYVRCECNGIAEIRLTGATTTIEHVAPGRYTLQVLDIDGRIKTSYPITIEEGQTTVAEIHVPE